MLLDMFHLWDLLEDDPHLPETQEQIAAVK
jgi:hypothetical protein